METSVTGPSGKKVIVTSKTRAKKKKAPKPSQPQPVKLMVAQRAKPSPSSSTTSSPVPSRVLRSSSALSESVMRLFDSKGECIDLASVPLPDMTDFVVISLLCLSSVKGTAFLNALLNKNVFSAVDSSYCDMYITRDHLVFLLCAQPLQSPSPSSAVASCDDRLLKWAHHASHLVLNLHLTPVSPVTEDDVFLCPNQLNSVDPSNPISMNMFRRWLGARVASMRSSKSTTTFSDWARISTASWTELQKSKLY